ncbi:MAG: 16S rRNA (adenine(1518)-N(6)/adenine(1519)-N(6))-dimethyltransferase RsmA [Candidatus Aquicultor sp.]|nr:16S rRNA (adenine(1518)-N(6)/adenine(1519)-N(6))-dimethyltransferase RsmA [Candidatus Aquicultor sp.]
MTLATPHATLEVVKKFSLRLDKSLGQHFLVDQNILNKIVDAAALSADDVVLEVGPGIGTLTQALAERAGKVISLELDRRLEPVLEYTLKDFPNAEVVFIDALKADLLHLPGHLPVPNKLVANLPYQIATPLLAGYLDKFEALRLYVVMIQKEVADRVMAKPATRDYGVFSVKAQFYCDTSKVATISRNVFIPPPEVSSAVIKMERYAKPSAAVADRDLFFAVVKGAFGMRRKTIKNALAGSELLHLDPSTSGELLHRAGIDPLRRGETLSIDEFARIANVIYEETHR